jgi:hypothetical protein
MTQSTTSLGQSERENTWVHKPQNFCIASHVSCRYLKKEHYHHCWSNDTTTGSGSQLHSQICVLSTSAILAWTIIILVEECLCDEGNLKICVLSTSAILT